MVIITLSGPQGAGKTVLAEFIAEEIKNRTGVNCEVHKGGQRRGAEYDTVHVDMTPDMLNKIINR
jgi:nucleoside-triphosphatase THEP1